MQIIKHVTLHQQVNFGVEKIGALRLFALTLYEIN